MTWDLVLGVIVVGLLVFAICCLIWVAADMWNRR